MVRRWLVALVLVGTALCLPASYKIYLVNGKVISADDKPVIRDGIAYFQKSNLELYLPVDQIDLVKTEKGGALLPATGEAATAGTKPAVRTIGEDQLEEISKRSRLANEGEFRVPVTEGAEGAEGAPAAPPPAGTPGAQAAATRNGMQAQMTSLLSQRADLQRRMVDLQTQMGSLRDRYNTSTQLTDKTALQGQMDGLQSQIDSARSQLTSVDANLQDTQQKMSAIPVVVDR